MARIVFLLEELSMARTLRGVLPRIFPSWEEGADWLAISHRGKGDLEKSIPRKLRGWRMPHDRFVIMRDNDGGDCRKLKARLRTLSADKPTDEVLIRIVVQELESWFLGDFDAIAAAYPGEDFAAFRNRSKFRDPEALTNASRELSKMIPGYRKTVGASLIAPHLDVDRNSTQSFQAFVAGLRALAASMD